jgi:hypothetical protein
MEGGREGWKRRKVKDDVGRKMKGMMEEKNDEG